MSSPGLLRSPGGGRPGAMPAVFSRPSLPELKPREVPCPTACWAVPRAGTLQEAPMGDIPMSSFCSRGCDQAQPSPVLLQGWGWGGNHPSVGFGEQIHAEWVVVWGCPQHLPVPHVGAGPLPAQGLCRDPLASPLESPRGVSYSKELLELQQRGSRCSRAGRLLDNHTKAPFPMKSWIRCSPEVPSSLGCSVILSVSTRLE